MNHHSACDHNFACRLRSGLAGTDTDAAIKQCPMCGVYIERNQGCAQMLCKSCKHTFCWYCLQNLDVSIISRVVGHAFLIFKLLWVVSAKLIIVNVAMVTGRYIPEALRQRTVQKQTGAFQSFRHVEQNTGEMERQLIFF